MTDWSLACRIEHEVARIITQQEINGVLFDQELAHKHVSFLEDSLSDLYGQVRPLLRKEVIRCGATVQAPWKKNGELSKRAFNYVQDQASLLGGPFSPVSFNEPDLGKRQKLIVQLLELGWTPYEYTDKGNPKITEESLEVLGGSTGSAIARWYILKHRKSQIEGWLKRPRLAVDGRLTAGAITCGTNTARFTHNTVVNVPKASDKVIFGAEMRSLFCVPEGKLLVGHDASGLEARMEGHYTFPFDDGEYARELLEGDVHSKNAEAFECDRNTAKSGKYCLTYGGSANKLAVTLGCSKRKAKMYYDNFWDLNVSLRKLKEKLIRYNKKFGYIPGIDGRKIYIRSEHSIVNALFQSAGSITMKMSMIFLDKWVTERGLDVLKVYDMHDESGAECSKDSAEEYARLAVKSVIQAGKYFKLKCPLDAEAKIGKTWADVH